MSMKVLNFYRMTIYTKAHIGEIIICIRIVTKGYFPFIKKQILSFFF